MINEKIQNYMYEFIKKICDDVGPRESGTKEEEIAGNIIEDELKKYCNKTYQEEYVSSPHAFLGGIRYGAILVLIVIAFYWIILLNDLSILQLGNALIIILLIISIIIIIITVSYFILEVMKYHETFDFLFPKKNSRNIIGIIEPTKEVRKTLIFSAHHDSAFEFNTFYYLKRFGQLIINIGYLGVVIILIGVIIRLIFHFFNISNSVLFLTFGIIFLCFIPIVAVYIFFHSYKPVLGAFDNLSGVAVLLGIGKFLSENKNNAEVFPQNTRVYLISFAGEESGLRGSKRYLAKHFKELKESNALIVNMDSIARKDLVVIHDKESGIGAKHDKNICKDLYDICKNLDLNAKVLPLPFGATDAATFSKKGIHAIAIGALNLKEELPPYYHTRLDTPDVIEKEALGQFLEICLKYLVLIDNR
ncbi:MAG: M28 family metallopeptidase [Promethearchaeota archaeon]